MYGDKILVVPILEAGVDNRNIYLPGNKSDIWKDVETGNLYEGGSWITKEVTLDTMPMLIRQY